MQFSAFTAYADHMGITSSVIPEPQNSDYESGLAVIDGETWHIRTARNTPTKQGAFVAFWRRDADGQTVPFRDGDTEAGLIVFVESDDRRGVFQFSAMQLGELGITAGARAGKRGFRVYPAWCTELNRQAAATQRAQAPAFREY